MMSSLRLTRVALLLVGIVLFTSGASRWSSYWTNPATTKFGERATLPELKVAPPSPMEQHFAGERQKWLHAWRTAPRGPNGLPLTDVGYLMKDLKRLPLSARVSGNIMEISKFQDGDACYYDAGRQAFMFVTDKTHRNYSLGGDRGREAMPAKEQGAYVIPRSVLPSEATTGTQARQRNVSFFFFDASGKMHGSCRLSEEDTYAIADFKPTVSSPAVAAPTIPVTPQRAAAEAELKQKIEHYEAPEQVKARQDNKRRLLDQATKARGQTDPCEPVFALRDAGKPIPAEVSLAPLTRGCNQQASPKDIAERRAKGCAWIAPVPYVVSAPTGVVDGRFWIGLDQRPSGNQVVFKDFGDLHTQLGRLTAVDIKFGPANNKQSATPRFSTTGTTVSIDDQAFPAFSDGTAFEHITISFRGERADANVHLNTARKADLQACRHNPIRHPGQRNRRHAPRRRHPQTGRSNRSSAGDTHVRARGTVQTS